MAVMAETPGTWHDSDPTTKVAWPVAVAAWVQATEAILETVAATYGGSITYEQLAQQLSTVVTTTGVAAGPHAAPALRPFHSRPLVNAEGKADCSRRCSTTDRSSSPSEAGDPRTRKMRRYDAGDHFHGCLLGSRPRVNVRTTAG